MNCFKRLPSGVHQDRTASIDPCSRHSSLPLRRPDTRIFSNAPSVEAKRTVPLPKEDLVAYLKSGCKPRTNWRCAKLEIGEFKHDSLMDPGHRIGTEHEKLGFNLGDNSRMTYAQIEAMLRKLESRYCTHLNGDVPCGHAALWPQLGD